MEDKVSNIFEQLRRLHEAIDDLYDSFPATTKISSDNYLRCEKEYAELSDMLVKQLVHSTELDYLKGEI